LNMEGLQIGERDRNRREVRIAFNLHAIGVVLHAMGRSSEAVPYLERALSVRQNMQPEELRANLNRLAETQFALAQALWHLGKGPARQRAVVMARQAQANYTEWGGRPENELSTVTAWLAAPLVKPAVLPFGGLVSAEGSRQPTPAPEPMPASPGRPAGSPELPGPVSPAAPGPGSASPVPAGAGPAGGAPEAPAEARPMPAAPPMPPPGKASSESAPTP
ncbi:MAG TPA: tetratricopeptide repeat protein, partial [Pseudomonadota bacterium]|nr:tetratricopeptide repeat protein [Pseudomonadota bacterium]